MSTFVKQTVRAVRDIAIGVDTAHAVFHGLPVPERARRRAPAHKH